MAGIELKNIHKAYVVQERQIQVLKGVHLQIPERSITVILGRSGCGKTTLLRVVGGLEEADAGEIHQTKNHKTAFVFQEARLMPWLNVWDNVKFGLKKQACRQEDVRQVLDMVGLHGFEKAYPNQLSGGMQQRVAIARALSYQPSFIMMDEPFAALDYFTRAQMQKELLRMQQDCGASILFVTHSIDEALLLGHKIVVMDEGKVKAEYVIEEKNEERDLLDVSFLALKKSILEKLDIGSNV